MQSQLAPPRRFVKAYHHHHDLQLQFIWTELILAHQTVMIAKRSMEGFLPTEENSHKRLHQITSAMMRLAGSAQEYMRLFAGDDDGIFNKLKNYCILFTLHESSSSIHAAMVQEASKAWLLSMQALTLLRMQANFLSSEAVAKTASYLEKIERILVRLMRLMTKIVSHYKSNENIVLFLVRHQKYLDAIMQEGFVISLLHKMFNQDLAKMREFLLERYAARGFHHLLTFINSAVDRLVKQ